MSRSAHEHIATSHEPTTKNQARRCRYILGWNRYSERHSKYYKEESRTDPRLLLSSPSFSVPRIVPIFNGLKEQRPVPRLSHLLMFPAHIRSVVFLSPSPGLSAVLFLSHSVIFSFCTPSARQIKRVSAATHPPSWIFHQVRASRPPSFHEQPYPSNHVVEYLSFSPPAAFTCLDRRQNRGNFYLFGIYLALLYVCRELSLFVEVSIAGHMPRKMVTVIVEISSRHIQRRGTEPAVA